MMNPTAIVKKASISDSSLYGLLAGLLFAVTIIMPIAFVGAHYNDSDSFGTSIVMMIYLPIGVSLYLLLTDIVAKQTNASRPYTTILIGLANFTYVIWAYLQAEYVPYGLLTITVLSIIMSGVIAVFTESFAVIRKFQLLSFCLAALFIVTFYGAFIGLAGMAGKLPHQYRLSLYEALTFPLYYYANEPDVSNVWSTISGDTSGEKSVRFYTTDRQSFVQYKYPGSLPTESCGAAYVIGTNLNWRCSLEYESGRYKLYQQRMVPSYTGTVNYFAIYGNQTVVRAEGTYSPTDFKGKPISQVIEFFDSLEQADIYSPRLRPILEASNIP